VHSTHRFVMEVRRPDGELLSRASFHPDWEPALECTRLAGLRVSGMCPDRVDPEPRLELVWHRTGQPLVEGFRIHMAQRDARWAEDFASGEYFADIARSVVAHGLEERHLDTELVHFSVSAYDAQAEHAVPPLGFTTAERPQPWVIRDRAFPHAVARSEACGDTRASDTEVVIPADLLDEVCAIAHKAGKREKGGIHIGHLCRDESPRHVGVEVTAHVPARHTVADCIKLTFTSATWTDVRAAVTLRQADEILVGWWHSHPARAWCADCPIERQRVCRFATGFMSLDDRALHRAIFPSAYTTALVVTDSIAGLDTRLFGWRRGVLEPRGYRIRASVEALPGSA
jgi:proteasome lid subunit RPN8/RPN11